MTPTMSQESPQDKSTLSAQAHDDRAETSNGSNEMHNTNDDEHQTSADDSTIDESRIAKAVYKELIRRVCIDYARNMHKLIKTGQIPVTELKIPLSRQEIFPELYKPEDIEEDPLLIEKELEKYARKCPITFS